MGVSIDGGGRRSDPLVMPHSSIAHAGFRGKKTRFTSTFKETLDGKTPYVIVRAHLCQTLRCADAWNID